MSQKQIGGMEESCHYCSQKRAEIFQAEGDYCLRCWQQETHPNVSP
jgi:hypothetical protein